MVNAIQWANEEYVSSGRNIHIRFAYQTSMGIVTRSNTSFVVKSELFLALLTLALVHIETLILMMVASPTVVLDVSYLSVIFMRISKLICQDFLCILTSVTRWSDASNVSELSTFVPF